MTVMFKCSWVMLFFKSKDTEVFKADRNKLFASSENQIDNPTLMLDMLPSNCQLCVPTIVDMSLKRIFCCGCCSLLIFVDRKATKGTEL